MTVGQYQEYVERLCAIDGMWMLYETLALSGLNALLACAAAFGFGVAIGWMWW